MPDAATMAPPSQKQQYLDVFEREHATTLRVLRQYPPDKLELQPHPKCKTARDLAWIFAIEQGVVEKVLTDTMEMPPKSPLPPAPQSWQDLLTAIEAGRDRIAGLVRGMHDEDLLKPVRFFVGPGQLGDVPKLQIIWLMLHDHIHRGQFSVYLRIADGKVPSIYGPSLDEPWM